MSVPSFVAERELNGDGFDLYFAGSQCKECEDYMILHLCNRLQSQLNDRKNIKKWCDNDNGAKLFIDSGAYSAHTVNKVLNVDEYIEFINSIDDYIHCFAQVDHIPGKFRQPKTAQQLAEAPKLSWQNYIYMKDRVKSKHKLLPIFHQGEDYKWLQNMLEYVDGDGHIQYIGISPANDLTTDKKKVFIGKCFDIISNSSNPNVKTHAFGMTSLDVLEMYPFYSADSTSWIMTAAMGNIMTPYGLIDVSVKNKYKPGNIQNVESKTVEHIKSWLYSKGLDLNELCLNYKQRMLCNIMYLEEWMKNYKYRGVTSITRSLF